MQREQRQTKEHTPDQTQEEKEPNLGEDLWNALKPILIILLVLLFLRWLYKKGTIENETNHENV